VDPLRSSAWSTPEMVAGFSRSSPNETLIAFADAVISRLSGRGTALDIGCGAGRNAVPMARLGWRILGTDLSMPMLLAAAERARREAPAAHIQVSLAPLDALPVRSASVDFVVAHGIWNLARSGAEFRRGVREAARAARPGAPLFLFTFSRHTLPPDATPVGGETFVFTQFSGQPQCFLTRDQLLAELGAARFVPDPGVPFTELNRPQPNAVRAAMPGPVIYQAAFVRQPD